MMKNLTKSIQTSLIVILSLVVLQIGAFAYTVGPLDEIAITVFDNPDLTGKFKVAQDGAIIYPLLGRIAVSGKTPAEIRRMLTERLERDYLYNPIVNVTVEQFRSKYVNIIGRSGKPTLFYLDREVRLLDLLSRVEGLSLDLGNIIKGLEIKIIRQPDYSVTGSKSGADKKSIVIDLYDLLIEGDKESNVVLRDKDVIYLPQYSTIYVIGEVRKPGSYPFIEGLTVLRALADAGGTTRNASDKEIVIKRIEDGKEVEVNADPDTPVKPGDIIQIPLGAGSGNLYYVVGEVNKPGSFTYEKDLTILMAITRAGGATKKASVKNTFIKRIQNGEETRIEVKMADSFRPDDIIEVPLSFW